MNKFLGGVLTILMIISLVACSDQKEVSTIKKDEKKVTEKVDKSKEPSQEEINEELKKEAVQANFVELNVENPPNDKRVFVDGEITKIWSTDVMGQFTLKSKEKNGYGMYSIKLLSTTGEIDYQEGNQVRVYGVVDGKDETGMPQIFATILEKK